MYYTRITPYELLKWKYNSDGSIQREEKCARWLNGNGNGWLPKLLMEVPHFFSLLALLFLFSLFFVTP